MTRLHPSKSTGLAGAGRGLLGGGLIVKFIDYSCCCICFGMQMQGKTAKRVVSSPSRESKVDSNEQAVDGGE